jgi:hypothetical protein
MTGVTITKGQVLTVNGIVNGELRMKPSLATAESRTDRRAIFVATEDVLDTEWSIGLRLGTIAGFDTSTLDVGKEVYLSATVPGAVTSTRPDFPATPVVIGGCVVSDASLGVLIVDIREDITEYEFNGCTLERQTISTVVDTGVIYCDVGVDNTTYGTNLAVQLAGEIYYLDCTTGSGAGGLARVALTAGTATTAQVNYVWVELNGGIPTLTAGSSWPAAPTAYARIADITVLDVSTTQSYGPLSERRHTDAIAHSGRGRISYIDERLRAEGAKWKEGVSPTATISTVPTPDSIGLTTTGGNVYQLHLQPFPSRDISTDGIFVLNASGAGVLSQYQRLTDLNEAFETSDGIAFANNNRYNLTVFGVVNHEGIYSKLYVSLPSDTYSSDSSAYNDVDSTSVTSVPVELGEAAFLICRIPVKYTTAGGGTFELIGTILGKPDVIDLRGNPVGTTGSAGGGPAQTFPDNIFRVFDDVDPTKEVALELSGVTTGTTRTLTIPDNDGEIILAEHGDFVEDVTTTHSYIAPSAQSFKTDEGSDAITINDQSIKKLSEDPWSTQTSAVDNSWESVCWSPELRLFCAVSDTGTGNRVMTSPDGVNWTSRTSAADNSWCGVCWSPELRLFCATACSGTGNRVMTSPDGINWTSRTSAADNDWRGVCWSPELRLFCAVADSGTGRVMTSPDGITWTTRTEAASNQWRSVCWSPELGLFCTVSLSGVGNRVMTSPDGINWTSRTSSGDNNWEGVCWSPERRLFCAVARSAGQRVMTSPDGINWTSRTSPASNNWRGVCWSPELGVFISVAATGTGNRIMISHDGITWRTAANPVDNDLRSVCWSPELGAFCAVAKTGAGNRVMTSFVTEDVRVYGKLSIANGTSVVTVDATAVTADRTLTVADEGGTLAIWETGQSPTADDVVFVSGSGNSLEVDATGRGIYRNAEGVAVRDMDIRASNTAGQGLTFFGNGGTSVDHVREDITEDDTANYYKWYETWHGSGAGADSGLYVFEYDGAAFERYLTFGNALAIIGSATVDTKIAGDLSMDGTAKWNGAGYYYEVRDNADTFEFVRNSGIDDVWMSYDSAFGIIYLQDDVNVSGVLSTNDAISPASGTQTIDGNIALESGIFSATFSAGSITGNRTLTIPNASGTIALTSGVVTDHGALSGLADDDHTQYSKTDGTRDITGDQVFLTDAITEGKFSAPDAQSFVNAEGSNVVTINDASVKKVAGDVWVSQTSAADNTWESICWSPELRLFCAVATSGTGNRVMTSSDGITWTTRTSAADSAWFAVCWSPELRLFCATGDSSSIMTSPDGITWTSRTSPTSSVWNGVCWSPELRLFCSVGYLGGPIAKIITSPDGINWTSRTAPANEQWQSVCWSPELGLFCAVADSGGSTLAMTSPDGITWTLRTSVANTAWQFICWSPELRLFCAVAEAGTNRIMTSPDGINWTARKIELEDWQSVCWAPELGLFCAVADTLSGDRIATSPDGITWTTKTESSGNRWNSVCWSPELGMFCATSGDGTGDRVMTSSVTEDVRIYGDTITEGKFIALDAQSFVNAEGSNVVTINDNAVNRVGGDDWTTRTSAADNNWHSVCWSPELRLFCAVAGSGTGNRVMTSPDGITWTIRTSAADNSWFSVCWSPELRLFCAVANSGTGNRVMTSPDGITWTTRTSAANNSWFSVCWSPELRLFCAVANSGTGNRVMTSPDGITWTTRTSAADNNWRSVCWSPELRLFCAVADSGTGNRVMTSPDGITWTIRTSAADNGWLAVCWSPELRLFCATANSGTGTRVMTSPDGINWSSRTSAADNTWRGVCWSPELRLFCAISTTGTGNRAMTSGVTEDARIYGDLHLANGTLEASFTDAGTASATEAGWIEVKIGGTTAYLRAYTTK